MYSGEATCTEVEDAPVRCQILPSRRFHVVIEVTQHMKVVKRTCNVPHAEIIRCNLRVLSGFGLSSLMHFVRACVCVSE